MHEVSLGFVGTGVSKVLQRVNPEPICFPKASSLKNGSEVSDTHTCTYIWLLYMYLTPLMMLPMIRMMNMISLSVEDPINSTITKQTQIIKGSQAGARTVILTRTVHV